MAEFSSLQNELDKKYAHKKTPKSPAPSSAASRQSASPVKKSPSKNAGSGFTITQNALEKKYNPDTSMVTQEYISSFAKRSRDYLSSHDTDYGQMDYTNSGSVLERRKADSDRLETQSRLIRAYLNKNKAQLESFQPGYYDQMRSYLDGYGQSAKASLDAFQQAADWYSYDVDKGRSELEALEGVRDQAREIQARMSRPAYAASSGQESEKELREQLDALLAPYGGYEGLEKQYTEKHKALSEHERDAEYLELSRVGNENSSYYDPAYRTLTGVNRLVEDTQYRWINDPEYREEYAALLKQGSFGADAPVNNFEEAALDRMTSEEIGTYNYHYAKGGKEQAQRYLKSIQETLNRRKAQDIFGEMRGKTFTELAFGLDAGVDQFQSGMRSALEKEGGYVPASAKQIASQMVRDDLKYTGPKLPEFLGGASLGQVAYDAVTTTSNMAPSILASTVAGVLNPGLGSAVGTGLMSASAGGSARQEMLNAGYTDAQASAYGMMIGTAEAAMQSALGGISKLGGGGLGKLTDKLSGGKFTGFLNKLDNAFLKTAVDLGENMLSEGTEEYLQEILDPLFRNVALMEDNEIDLISPEALYSGLLGMMTAGVMEGPSTIAGGVSEAREKRAKAAEAVDAAPMQQNEEDATPAQQKDPLLAMLEQEAEAEQAALPSAAQNTEEFKQARQAAVELGRAGQNLEDAMNDERTQYLSEAQREWAWKEGLREGGYSLLRENGETVKVKGLVDAGDALALELEDGRIVKHGDVILSTQSEEAALRGIEGLKVNAEDANSLMAAFREGDVTGDVYAQGVQAAFRAGGKNIPMQELSRNTSAAAALSEAQRDTAYKLGQKYAQAQTAQAEAVLAGTATAPGRVHYDGDASKLSEIQQTSIKALETVADALGVQIYLYESRVGEDGLRDKPNGRYNTKTGDIHIDIHAGESGKGTMLFTAAHELTHFVKQWSPGKFKKLADFLMEQYGEVGASMEELIERQQAKAKRTGRELSYDDAFEELVADSMESMLADGSIVEKLAELKQRDKGLWQKLKEKISELVGKLKKAYEGLKPDSKEGQYVAEMLDAAEELKRLFAEGLEDASRRFRAGEASGEAAADAGAEVPETDWSDFDGSEIEFSLRDTPVPTWDDLENKPPMKVVDISTPQTHGTFAQRRRQILNGAEKVMEKPYRNKDTGVMIFLTPKSYSHAFSNPGEVQINATEHLPELIENAVLVHEEKPTHGSEYADGVYTFFAAAKTDRIQPVKLTVKEYAYDGQLLPKNIRDYFASNPGDYASSYDTVVLEVEEIEESPFGSVGDSTKRGIAPNPNELSEIRVTDLLGLVKGKAGKYIPDGTKFSERDPGAAKLYQALEKGNQAQREEIGYLRELVRLQGKVTNGTKFARSSVEHMAGQLMKEAGAKGDRKELAGILNGVYEYIAGLSDPAVAPDWEDIAEQTRKAAQWLVDHVETKPDRGEYADEILRELRTMRISLNEGQTAEVASRYGSYNDFRKATFGSFVLAKDGTPLDVAWQDLAAQYPAAFDADTGDADMPLKLAEIVETLRDTDLAAAEFEADREGLTAQMQQAVYDGYWKVSTLYTVADAWQKKVDDLKGKHQKTMAELKQARADIDKLNRSHAEELRQLRREKRKGIRTAQAETAKRYQDARKKTVEGRNKTAARHRIEKTVRELEKLLLKGDKKKHVKEGMRGFIEKAISSANVLFSGSLSDEELVLAGIGTDLTGREQELVGKAKIILAQKQDLLSEETISGEAEDVIAGDTRSYDERMRLAGQLDRRLAPVLKELGGVLQRERSRLNKATVADALNDLAAAYHALGESDDLYIRGATREEVHQHLLELVKDIGGTLVRDMTLDQLTKTADAYRMVLTTVREANKLFNANARQTLSEAARMAALEVTSNGKRSKLGVKLVEELKKFGFNNLKPTYFFEHLNSNTLRQLYKGLLEGQSGWARDVSEAREFFRQASRRCDFGAWDMEKTNTFRAASGEEFKLNLQQAMSLYAYSRRDQARDHLRKGGIVINSETDIEEVVEVGGKFKVKLKGKSTDATAYNIDDVTLDQIIGKLTAQQKQFVEEMQAYLSDVMGSKGNEVSMKLYGVKLFKEQNYFPLKSAHQYMARAKEQAEQTAKVKNAGFTKSTTRKASNPVVLTPFMDVWADHVDEMSLYHTMALPLEDLHRVYTFSQTGDGGQASQSVTAAIENAFGKQATDYFDQLMKDLNGGARVDNTTGLINKSMGLFKKGSVFLSASVVIQQPSAILRATALVDSKYFQWAKLPGKWGLDATFRRKQHDRLWAEVKRCAPVALIKEMGYFDTSVGRSTRDYIQAPEYDGFKEKMQALVKDSGYRDEVLSRAPALADELAWCSIWEAVKRETLDKRKDLSAGSEAFLKAAGERFTEVIDKTQVYDSVLARSANMRSKDTGMKMATAFMAESTVSANMAADALLKGKRGDKRFARRAIGSVISSGILNAMLYSLVAAARDDDEDKEYWEKYLGSVTGEIFEVLNPLTYLPFGRDIVSLVQGYDVERSDMALASDLINAFRKLGSDNLTGLEKVEDFCGTLFKLAGLPLGNVWRDAKALYNVLTDAVDGQQSTAAGFGYAVMENLPFRKTVSNGQQLYEAMLEGNQDHADRVTARFKDESAARTALRKALRENDPRIREAAVAWNEGRLEDYMALAKEVIGEKHFSQDDVVLAIRAEADSLLPESEETQSTRQHKGLFTAEQFTIAAADGDRDMMAAIREDLIQAGMDNGKTREAAEKSAESSCRSVLKECVLAGSVTEQQAQTALAGYCGLTAEEAAKTVAEWAFESDRGYKRSERMDRFLEAAVDGSSAASGIREDVIAAEMVGGDDRETAEKGFQSSFRSALGDLYEAEGVSDTKAVSLLEKYGGRTSEEAQGDVRYWSFTRDNPDANVERAWVNEYYDEVAESGLDIETFVEYRNLVKDITGANKKAGRMAVIDAMDISSAQKDALYYAEGWAKSRIGEAPWH